MIIKAPFLIEVGFCVYDICMSMVGLNGCYIGKVSVISMNRLRVVFMVRYLTSLYGIKTRRLFNINVSFRWDILTRTK
jgi:hypothetical protein